MKQATLIIFLLAVVGTVISDIADLEFVYIFSKPMILISLITHYYLSLKSEYRSTLLVVALIFCLAGDIFLMKEEYFIPGLVSFLIGHIVYIFVYRQHQSAEQMQALQGVQRIRMAFPIVLAGTGLVVVLYPRLGGLQIPVMIYALVITLMTLTALFRYGRTSAESFWMVFFGAVLFMVSDSILAINKFLSPINFAGVYIMLTYAAAQFLIVKGLVKHPQEN